MVDDPLTTLRDDCYGWSDEYLLEQLDLGQGAFASLEVWQVVRAECERRHLLSSDDFQEGNEQEAVKHHYAAAEALESLHLAAKDGDVDAQYELGLMYMNGNGVERNYAEGLKWLRKAGEQSHEEAQLTLGESYLQGWGTFFHFGGLGSIQLAGIRPDHAEALKWFQMAAEQGNWDAQWQVKLMSRKPVADTPLYRRVISRAIGKLRNMLTSRPRSGSRRPD